MGHLLGIDVGTSGVKSVLVGEDGRVRASASAEMPVSHPKIGWAEQHPETWWRATVKSVRKLLANSRVRSADITALGLSGQMHGLVLLDARGRVIRPAILWCDTRTKAECELITEKIGRARLLRLVCNPALEGFTLPKLMWVRRHEPANYKKARTMLLPKDYIRFRMTGAPGIDISDGAGTLMLDVARRRWSRELTRALNIDEALLPPLGESTDIAGTLIKDAARELGLAEKTLVAFGGADNTCAAVGAGIIKEGIASASIGTSGVVFAASARIRRDRLGRVHSFNHSVPGTWYVMGVMQSAGFSLRWLRGALGAKSYDELTAEAAAIRPGADGLIFLPYLNGERTPHLDANTRGAFVGLTAMHGRAHLVRAVLEGVAFGLRDSLEIIREMRTPVRELRLLGGGARSGLWRQIVADVFGEEISIINIEEGPAYGAALIAGVGAKVYRGFDEATAKVRVVKRITPDAARARFYTERYEIYRALYPALKGTFEKLKS